MHRAGVDHRDLNLTNVLVRWVEGAGAEVMLIDFDRARLLPGPLPKGRAARRLARMLRSLRKLDAAGRFSVAEDLATFARAYGDGARCRRCST
jgi:serine/threonine protein kinase